MHGFNKPFPKYWPWFIKLESKHTVIIWDGDNPIWNHHPDEHFTYFCSGKTSTTFTSGTKHLSTPQDVVPWIQQPSHASVPCKSHGTCKVGEGNFSWFIPRWMGGCWIGTPNMNGIKEISIREVNASCFLVRDLLKESAFLEGNWMASHTMCWSARYFLKHDAESPVFRGKLDISSLTSSGKQ